MNTICDYLVFDHKRCNDLFMLLETSIGGRDWAAAESCFQSFHSALRTHISMEERVLFPAFGKTMPLSYSAIAMLRDEHRQIAGIVDRMAAALGRRDTTDFLLHAETFTILSQQHSMKEEDMLYPLLDKVVMAETRNAILDAMREYIEPASESSAG